MLPGLAKHVDCLSAHNDYTNGFLVVRKVAHETVYGYVWEHTLADGTTTWVAQPGAANNASSIAGFQSKEWAADFLYEREWPTFLP